MAPLPWIILFPQLLQSVNTRIWDEMEELIWLKTHSLHPFPGLFSIWIRAPV